MWSNIVVKRNHLGKQFLKSFKGIHRKESVDRGVPLRERLYFRAQSRAITQYFSLWAKIQYFSQEIVYFFYYILII